MATSTTASWTWWATIGRCWAAWRSSAPTSLAALISVYLRSDLIAVVVCTAVVVTLVATGIFGRAELTLLTSRLHRFSRSLWEPTAANGPRVHQTTIRIQGTRPWEALWETLVDAAGKLGLKEMHLDVNLPRVHEGFHASWEYPSMEEAPKSWRVEVPLIVEDQLMGHLTIVAQHGGGSASEEIERLLSILKPFKAQFRAISAPEPWQAVPEETKPAAVVQRFNAPILAPRRPK